MYLKETFADIVHLLAYPVVVYAGLMYGANNLVWPGVQNATTGTVYVKEYGFNTLDVAGAYTGALIGSISGYVGDLLMMCFMADIYPADISVARWAACSPSN